MASLYQRNKNIINKISRDFIKVSRRTSMIGAKDSDYVLRVEVVLDNDYGYCPFNLDVRVSIKSLEYESYGQDTLYILANTEYKIVNCYPVSYWINIPISYSNDRAFSAICTLLFDEDNRWKSEGIRRDYPELEILKTEDDAESHPEVILDSGFYKKMKHGIDELLSIIPESKLVDGLYPKITKRINTLPIAVLSDGDSGVTINTLNAVIGKDMQSVNPSSRRGTVSIDSSYIPYSSALNFIPVNRWIGLKVFESGLTEVDKTYKWINKAYPLRL